MVCAPCDVVWLQWYNNGVCHVMWCVPHVMCVRDYNDATMVRAPCDVVCVITMMWQWCVPHVMCVRDYNDVIMVRAPCDVVCVI